MSGIILDPGTKRKAREIVIAPRLPERPDAETYRSPFDSEGDIVVECDVAGCGYNAMGPRRLIGLALREHHRLFHPEQTGVILLNAPRQ